MISQQLVEACAPFGQVMACVLRPSGSSCSMWGLVGFKQADQADRLLGVKTPLRLADSFLVAHRSNLAQHLRWDVSGALLDAWLSLCTLRLWELPASAQLPNGSVWTCGTRAAQNI